MNAIEYEFECMLSKHCKHLDDETRESFRTMMRKSILRGVQQELELTKEQEK